MVFSSSECIIWFTVFTVEFVATAAVNLLAIIIFIKNRSLRTRSMYLVISLTVADMLVGVLSGSFVQFDFLQTFTCWSIKLNLPLEVRFSLWSFYFFFPFVSLANLVVISLERFHATFRPFRHRLIKRWVYVVAIVVVWVFPLIVSVSWAVVLIVTRYSRYIRESFCLLCLIVTFVSYSSILFKFRFGAHPQRHCAVALRQRKLTFTLFITTLVSLLLWLPYSILLFLTSSTDMINSLSLVEYFHLFHLLHFFYYANSFVNPILYTIRMPDFKKALFSLFRRPQRENVAIPLNRF